MLEGLRALQERHGLLTYRLIDDSELTASSATYAKRFGSVIAAAASVGVEKPGKRVYGRDEVVAALQALHAEHGRLSVRILKRIEGAPSEAVLRRHFGSASGAFEAAGIGPSPPPLRHSDENLLASLRRLQREHGRVSKKLIESDAASPTYMTYLRRFGTMKRAYALISGGERLARGESSPPPEPPELTIEDILAKAP